MEIIHFDDPGEFQDHVMAYLAQHEAENNLILGILANLIAGEYSEKEPYLAIVKEAEKILAVSLCTPPWPVLVSYVNPPPEKTCLKVMLADMQSVLQDDFTGLSGNKEFVSRLVAIWEEESGKKAILKMAMRIYKLTEVQPVTGVPGRMRKARRSERSLLEDWYACFHRDAMHEEPDLLQVQKQVEGYLAADPRNRGLMIWEVGGQPVSMAGYAGPTPHGIRVGAVYTPPGQRKQGYASALTAGISQYLLDKGFKFCFLFTDLVNLTSNHIYMQIGYQPVSDADRYLFI